MLTPWMVLKEDHARWPAKNNKPAGEGYDLVLVDMSDPPEHRMNDTYKYRMDAEEVHQYWGKCLGRFVLIGFHRPAQFNDAWTIRGKLVKVAETLDGLRNGS